MPETVSLEEAAALELRGAYARLQRAKQALEDHVAQHANPPASEELAEAFARERHALAVELDDSVRQHAHCRAEFVRIRRQRETGEGRPAK